MAKTRKTAHAAHAARSSRAAGPEDRAETAAPGRRGNLRDPERTSAAILAAAVREFAEQGYGGARIDGIAERADINKRMLYHYYGNKEDLYVAVLEKTYSSIRSAEHALKLSERDPMAALKSLITFTWKYYLANPDFLSVLAIENMNKAKFLKRSARILDLNSPLIESLSVILRDGAALGLFRPDADPLKVYISIASLGAFFLTNRWTLSAVFGRDLVARDEIDAWGLHMVDVITSYLRPTPPAA